MGQLAQRLIFFIFLSNGLVLFFGQVHAVEDPVMFAKTVTSRVLSAVRKSHVPIQRNDKELNKIVKHIMLPHVDFYEMSRWVAGRNSWRGASKTEQTQFVEEFKILVVRTYAQALKDFYDDEITFDALRASCENEKRIMVSSVVLQDGITPIRILFRLVRHGDGWKIYDLVVEGVSLLKGYQSQFLSKIRRNGLASVTYEIRFHNRGL